LQRSFWKIFGTVKVRGAGHSNTERCSIIQVLIERQENRGGSTLLQYRLKLTVKFAMEKETNGDTYWPFSIHSTPFAITFHSV
jgi:hypothetical protein